MTYYKVLPHADQIQKGIRFVNSFLVANELYTAREVEKAIQAGRIDNAFVHNHLKRIKLRKNDTYFLFGARFTNRNITDNTCSVLYISTK